MKKIILGLLIVFSFSVAAKVHARCDFRNPHSFDCQNETFAGRIFPLQPLNFEALNENWISNQFTPAPGVPSDFKTITAQGRPHRTCALLNNNGTRVGAMRFQMGRRSIVGVSIANFIGRNLRSDSKVSFENESSVIFGAGRGRETFRCRLFTRVGSPHLTCQYFRDRIFRGYLGFLPANISCR